MALAKLEVVISKRKVKFVRAISVIKQRVGQHERALRELCMSNRGVEIGEQLSKFRGILTGVPESSDQKIAHQVAEGNL